MWPCFLLLLPNDAYTARPITRYQRRVDMCQDGGIDSDLLTRVCGALRAAMSECSPVNA